MRKIILFLVAFLLTGCFYDKKPLLTKSILILIKSPKLKYYDNAFLTKYDDSYKLDLYSAGTPILKVYIYKHKVCKNDFLCQDILEFNKSVLGYNKKRNILFELLNSKKKNIRYKDSEILIKLKETK
jgi:hypothetical protein